MFIKIGDMIINDENLDGIKKGTRYDGEYPSHEYVSFNYANGNQTVIREGDDYYPQALAAYDWFCKAAIRFDGSPAPQAEASKQRDAATELYSGKHERIEELKKQMEENREYHVATKRRLETTIEDAIEELLLSDDAGYTDYQVAVRAALKILVMYKQGDNANTAD